MSQEPEDTDLKHWRLYLCVLVICIFAAMVFFTQDSDRAFLSALASVNITLAARARWDLRLECYYWLLLLLITLAHAAGIAWTNIELPEPAILVAPLVYVDFAIILCAMYAIEGGVNSLRSRN